MDAHVPYMPPHPFDTFYPGKDKSFTTKDWLLLNKEIIQLKRKITEREYRHLVSQYDGAIAYLDFHIGQLIERLKKLDLYEKSLIIITSDHGEAFGEKNLFEHGVSVYQNQVCIPLIIKYSDILKKRRVDQLVSLVDIMPTILDLVDCNFPDGVQGQSLSNLTNKQDRVVVAEHFAAEWMPQWHPRVQWALFSDALKFIKSTEGKPELYSLAEDPNEEVNLYEIDDKSHQLEERLDQWLKDVKEALGTVPQVRKDTLEKLKSLGYIGDKKAGINKKQSK